MPLWAEFVDLVYASLFCLSAAFGGSMGLAIVVLSSVVRLALLPVTLRLAYRALEMQVALEKIRPRVERIRERHKADSRRAAEETARLYRENGIALVDGGTFLGTALQAPILLAVFAAIRRGAAAGGRFLWVADLGRADAVLACLCAVVTAASAALAPSVSPSPRLPTIAFGAILTLVFLSRMAAGVSLYTLASGVVGLGQTMLVRRRAARLLTAPL